MYGVYILPGITHMGCQSKPILFPCAIRDSKMYVFVLFFPSLSYSSYTHRFSTDSFSKWLSTHIIKSNTVFFIRIYLSAARISKTVVTMQFSSLVLSRFHFIGLSFQLSSNTDRKKTKIRDPSKPHQNTNGNGRLNGLDAIATYN